MTETQVLWGAPALFVAFWWVISILIARLGGWTQLAEWYATNDDFPAKRLHFRSMQIGMASYSNAITIALDSNSLYLRPFLLFRLAHAPLKIPYRDLTARVIEGRRGRHVTLSVARAPELTLTLTRDVADAIQKASHGGWTYGPS